MLSFALPGARWRWRRFPPRQKSSAWLRSTVITAGTLRLNWRRGLMRPEKISGKPLGVINRRSIHVKHSEVYNPFPNPIVLLNPPTRTIVRRQLSRKFLVKHYFHNSQIRRLLFLGKRKF